MTIAVPGLRSSPCDELPLSFESTVVLIIKRVWLDIRHDAGRWYASLRIKEPCAAIAPQDGVNGFCDVWNGPHHTRDAAMSNGYAFRRHRALKAHVPTAKQLHRSVWSYLPCEPFAARCALRSRTVGGESPELRGRHPSLFSHHE